MWVVVLVLAFFALCAPASAARSDEISAFADRAASVWAGRQDSRGFFLDPRSGAPVEGYGNAMLGYALLRAGERAGDERLVRSGVDAIRTTLDEPPGVRGVFDLLAVATAYHFARERLEDDPAFAAARGQWEAYLRTTVAPNIDNEVRDCIASDSCFHNHEAVGAAAELQLLATGLESSEPGALLADRDALRRAALEEVGVALPSFARGDAAEGPALLSDTGNQPLAYHALSTAMFARAVELLGDEAPEAARAALRRTTGALAGLMAPDGTVAYIGKRQESLWSLAGAIAAAEIASRAADAGDDERALYHAVSDRALARIRALYPLTPRGLPIVPRSGPDAFAPDGVDGDPMTFNGLALFLLNLAADGAEGGDAAALPADADGAFVDRTQNGFAAVRRGNVWFAVHRRHPPRDVRNDFGLVAAKWRAPSGGWVDVLPPRPMRFEVAESAGPVVERDGRRLVPLEGTLAVGNDGEVTVRASLGGEPVTYRFTPLARGVRISLPARAGDVVTYTAYLPADEARVEGDTVARGDAADEAGADGGSVASGDAGTVTTRDTGTVTTRDTGNVTTRDTGNVTTRDTADEVRVDGETVTTRDTVVTASPAPSSIRLDGGFASCCDARMVAARIRVPVLADGTVSYTVAARAGARAPAPIGAPAGGADGGTPWWLVAALAFAAVAGALVLRRRAVVRRRRRRRAARTAAARRASSSRARPRAR
jgi:hypothetical protein